MDFSWTDEQELWRKTVRDFAQKKIKPRVREIDTNKKIPDKITVVELHKCYACGALKQGYTIKIMWNGILPAEEVHMNRKQIEEEYYTIHYSSGIYRHRTIEKID